MLRRGVSRRLCENKKYMLYKIEITFSNGSSHQIDLETDRLEWSMEQYQRNRPAFTWKVLEKK